MLWVACGLGLCVGSFCNVVIHRLPRGGLGTGGSRSRCPRCEARIGWRDNVPVVSFLLLRGCCRHCGDRIGWRYPVVESLTAMLFVLTAARIHDLEALVIAIAMTVFVVASFIDLEHRILPDSLTLPWAVVFVAASAVLPELQAGHWLAGEGSVAGAVAASVAGCLGAVATVAAVRSMGTVMFRKRLRAEGLQEAMGLGDVKFAATFGALLGLPGAWWAFLLAIVTGAVVGVAGIAVVAGRSLVGGSGLASAWRIGRAKGGVIPFGPFLAAGAASCLLFEHEIHDFLTRDWPHWVAGRLGGG